MSLKVGTEHSFRAAAAYHKGKVGSRGLDALLETLKDSISSDDGPAVNPRKSIKTAQTSTPAEVKGSAGVLYGVRVTTGTLAVAGSTAVADVIVQITDNDIVIASVKCGYSEAAEAYFYGGDGAVGITCATDIEVKAVQAADGSSNPAAVDRPDIEVIYG